MEGFDQLEVVDNVVEDEVTRDDDPKSDMSNEDFPQNESNSINSIWSKLFISSQP